jgi:hypothetical protein
VPVHPDTRIRTKMRAPAPQMVIPALHGVLCIIRLEHGRVKNFGTQRNFCHELNMGLGGHGQEEVKSDKERLMTMQTPGANMAWLMKKINV